MKYSQGRLDERRSPLKRQDLCRVSFGALLVMVLSTMASACPFCKDATATAGMDGTGTPPPGGLFNASILYMLAGVLVVMGLVVGKVVLAIRGANASNSAH